LYGGTDLLSSYVGGGVWTGSNGTVTVSPAGVITGIYTGADTITYTVTNSCGRDATTHIVTVYLSPVPGTITGVASICSVGTTTLTDIATGGIWSSNSVLIATVGSTGVVSGISAGTALISYTVTTGCGIAAATQPVTVNTTTAGIITGVTSLCAGGSSSLGDAITGGTWASSAAAVATVSSGGTLTAMAGGSTIISYTVSGACGTAVATTDVTVGSLPIVEPITGITTICNDSTVLLNDGTLDGLWSSSNTAVASVNSSGVVTGVSAGTSTISYVVTAGCGAAGVTAIMHIQSMPSAGAISGSATVCAGATTTLTDAVTGGAWSSSNTTIASVTAGGTVHGVGVGAASISYGISNSCGTDMATAALSVGTMPSVAPIAGITTICDDSVTLFSDDTLGGVWSSSNTFIATINSIGLLTGVSAGTSTISYAVTAVCGTASAATTVHLQARLSPTAITCASSICAGATATLSDATTGGTWNGSDIIVASVNSGGIITALSAGSITISYSMSNSCGTAIVTFNDTVNTAPAAGFITGATNICVGAVTTLADGASGGSGTWSTGSSAIAMAGSGGVVTGFAAGSDVVFYTVANSCGSNSASAMINVDPLPYIEEITGATTVTIGNTASLYDAVAGGSWSSGDPAVATINAAGIVTGVSLGTATISYTMINGFGCTADTAFSVTVEAASGIKNVNGNSGYTLYPNPATNEVTVSWGNQTALTAEVVITDIVGKDAFRSTIVLTQISGSTKLNLPEGLEGSYIITIRSTSGYYSGKLVILKE